MEKEEKSGNIVKLEDGPHKWICFDHSHPHLFKDGKCLNCGLVDRESLNISSDQVDKAKKIVESLGFKLRDESKPRERLPGEIDLPPKLKAVWDFATNYASKWDMIKRGVYKPTLVELDQMNAKKITLRIDKDGNIIKVTPVEEEDKKE